MNKMIFPLMVIMLVLTACSLPTSQSEDALRPEDIAMTIIAQTQTAEAAAFTATPQPPTDTPEPENPPTSAVTTVSVSIATNCRTGPDVAYALVMVFQPGATAEVVGKYVAPEYWIIKTPTNETCWLWGEYATVEGNISILPDMVPPAPPVVEVVPTEEGNGNNDGDNNGGGIALTPMIVVLPPAPPANFSAVATCQFLTVNNQKIIQSKIDTLTWSSVNGATGYKLYVNGVQEQGPWGVATSIDVDAIALKSNKYGIAAYNDNGTSTIKTINAPSCQ